MLQTDVYEQFKVYFPEIAFFTETWFPNGQNSVRIRQTNGQDFVFTYNGKQDWCFETIDSYIKKMKGDKRWKK